MKKLFFSAVALVVFSGVSMANKRAALTRPNCTAVWGATKIYAINQGFSDAQANSIAFAAYDRCIGCD